MAAECAPIDSDHLHTEVGAAKQMKLSVRTLQAWRSHKVGPPFVRVGRAIRYRQSDLVMWLRSNTVQPVKGA
jgi:hypothetical protein